MMWHSAGFEYISTSRWMPTHTHTHIHTHTHTHNTHSHTHTHTHTHVSLDTGVRACVGLVRSARKGSKYTQRYTLRNTQRNTRMLRQRLASMWPPIQIQRQRQRDRQRQRYTREPPHVLILEVAPVAEAKDLFLFFVFVAPK
jgi:hypothetical protein